MSQPSLGFVGGADGPVTVFASGGGTALLVYLVLINLVTFFVYGADKRRARQGKWRVPEKTLFLLPLLGGSVGALLGMRVFHHKTKHWYFVWGVPAILLAQLALGGLVTDEVRRTYYAGTKSGSGGYPRCDRHLRGASGS